MILFIIIEDVINLLYCVLSLKVPEFKARQPHKMLLAYYFYMIHFITYFIVKKYSLPFLSGVERGGEEHSVNPGGHST